MIDRPGTDPERPRPSSKGKSPAADGGQSTDGTQGRAVERKTGEELPKSGSFDVVRQSAEQKRLQTPAEEYSGTREDRLKTCQRDFEMVFGECYTHLYRVQKDKLERYVEQCKKIMSDFEETRAIAKNKDLWLVKTPLGTGSRDIGLKGMKSAVTRISAMRDLLELELSHETYADLCKQCEKSLAKIPGERSKEWYNTELTRNNELIKAINDSANFDDSPTLKQEQKDRVDKANDELKAMLSETELDQRIATAEHLHPSQKEALILMRNAADNHIERGAVKEGIENVLKLKTTEEMAGGLVGLWHLSTKFHLGEEEMRPLLYVSELGETSGPPLQPIDPIQPVDTSPSDISSRFTSRLLSTRLLSRGAGEGFSGLGQRPLKITGWDHLPSVSWAHERDQYTPDQVSHLLSSKKLYECSLKDLTRMKSSVHNPHPVVINAHLTALNADLEHIESERAKLVENFNNLKEDRRKGRYSYRFLPDEAKEYDSQFGEYRVQTDEATQKKVLFLDALESKAKRGELPDRYREHYGPEKASSFLQSGQPYSARVQSMHRTHLRTSRDK